MTKKNFKQNNPAMAFISMPELENPIQDSPIDIRDEELKEGYKRNPEYIETKSKRVQLLLQPSVVDALKTLAKEKGLSMNETANEAIKSYLGESGKHWV